VQDKIGGIASSAGAAAVGLAAFTADHGYWHPSVGLLQILWIAMWCLAGVSIYCWGRWLWSNAYPPPAPGISLENGWVRYDAMNSTLMDVHFAVMNSGPPVSLRDFKLHVDDPLGGESLTPEAVYMGTVATVQIHGVRPASYPRQETFADRPLAQGEHLTQCYFRIVTDGDFKTLYGNPNTKLSITAKDSLGKSFRLPVSWS